MFRNEEDELSEMKEKYQKVAVPDQIDNYIRAGLNQATKHKKRKWKVVFSTGTVAVMLFIFLVSIRISPVFASYVGQVPGLDRLVALIQGDKGLESAIENDFVQVINKSDTHDGITFTVDEIIADESRMIVFYTIESEEAHNYVMLSDLEMADQDGENIVGAISYGSHVDDVEKESPVKVKGKVEIDFNMEAELPKQINMKTYIDARPMKNIPSDKPWEISFEVDQDKFAGKKETYTLDETVSVEGQKVTFKDITVYPTKIAVHVVYDKENTMELFSFDDLAIVDEDGEEWAGITNGSVATVINEYEEKIYLQSNFFEQPEKLFLEFSSIRALDKDKLDVEIDLEQGKLLKKPDSHLELTEALTHGSVANLTFKIKRSNPFDENYFYQIFGHLYYDEIGNEYEIENGTGSSSSGDEMDFETYLSVKKLDDNSPITLQIIDYPTRIEKDVKIKIK